MRILKTKDVIPGTALGRTIYRDDGLPLLTKGTQLSQRLIDRLQEEEILMLYIEDPLYEGIEPSSPIRDVTLNKGTQAVKRVFEVLRSAVGFKNPKDADLTYIYDSQIIDALQNVIEEVIDDIGMNPDTLYQIISIASVDQYTYRHSVDVAILSMLMGRAMGYDYKTVKILGMGGILHDVGKAHIDQNVITKNGPLTDAEWEEMKLHPLYGYNAVRDVLSIHGFVKQIILHHHERLDGSGYPSGLQHDQINMLSRIVTVSDMFNALGSNRIYRAALTPDKILDMLYADAVYKVDRQVIQALLKVVHIYPEGSLVRLTDGREAIVVDSRKISPTRPLVKIISDSSYVDLMQHLTLFIDSVM